MKKRGESGPPSSIRVIITGLFQEWSSSVGEYLASDRFPNRQRHRRSSYLSGLSLYYFVLNRPTMLYYVNCVIFNKTCSALSSIILSVKK